MPKEITHWYLADRIRAGIPGESVFHGPCHEYENLFFLGAVTPDTPFYYLLGPGSKPVRAASGQFHTPDRRALRPVLRFLERFPEAPALALAAGVMCHLVSDTMFHPLVVYFSGKDGVHDGATARHRQFETAMDLHVRFLAGKKTRVSLGRIVRGRKIPRRQLNGLLSGLFGLNGREAQLGNALFSHCLFTAAFRNYAAYRAVKWLNRKGVISDTVPATAYPLKQPEPLPFFSRSICFRDPESGRPCRAGIPEMVLETATRANELLGMIAGGMNRGKDLLTLLDFPGLPEIRPDVSICRWWLEQPDIIPILYQGTRYP